MQFPHNKNRGIVMHMQRYHQPTSTHAEFIEAKAINQIRGRA